MIIGSFLRRSLVRGGCLTALAAAMLLGAGLPASADYYDAVTAYDRADYAAARAELEPLAAAGDARAQLLLGRMHAAGQGVLQE
jgi:TPR repeat protein